MPMGELRGGAGRQARRSPCKKRRKHGWQKFWNLHANFESRVPLFFSRVSGWQRARGTKNSQVEVPLGVKSGILFQAAKLHFV